MSVAKLVKQQLRYAPLYYVPITLAYLFLILMGVVKVAMIRQSSMTFLDVYFRWFDAYLLGVIFLPMSAMITLMTIVFRPYDYLLAGSRKLLYRQMLIQALLVHASIWLPWLLMTLFGSYAFGVITNYQAGMVIVLSTLEVFCNQFFLLLMGLIGYLTTRRKVVGLMAIIGVNLLLFSLHLNKIVTPFWKFTLSQSPSDKLVNVVVLVSLLYLFSVVLLTIIKKRDY